MSLGLEEIKKYLPPNDWREYMQYFGPWCNSFGNDVKISFIHEHKAFDNYGVLTTLRFELCSKWNNVLNNKNNINSDTTNENTVYYFSLKFRWPKRSESKAILSKALFCNLFKSVPFMSVNTILNIIAHQQWHYYIDIKRLCLLFKNYSDYIIGYSNDISNQLPYISLDCRMIVKIYRSFMSIINSGSVCTLASIISCAWKNVEWQEFNRRIVNYEAYSALQFDEIIKQLNIQKQSEQKDLSFFSVNNIEEKFDKSIKSDIACGIKYVNYSQGVAKLYFALPTFILSPTHNSVNFLLKLSDYNNVRVQINLREFNPYFDLNDDYKSLNKHIISAQDFIGTNKLTPKSSYSNKNNLKYNKVCNVTSDTDLGSVIFILTYEGGYIVSDNILEMLSQIAISLVINYIYSRHGIQNSVLSNVSIGTEQVQKFYSQLGYINDYNGKATNALDNIIKVEQYSLSNRLKTVNNDVSNYQIRHKQKNKRSYRTTNI